jgi:catechol 2,3-dioxygenase-like lactoylglutathione lyase family enzyme
MIKRLSHICLSTGNLQKVKDFYCNILGCRLIHEFRNRHGELYGLFLLVNNATFVEFFKDDQPKVEGGLFRHLCFEVENIERWAGMLSEKGFQTDIHRGRSDGALQCWITDPDGNKVEFHQYDQEAVQYRYII